MKRSLLLRSAFVAALVASALAAQALGRVVINPILTARTDGTGRVASVAYESYVDKIYAQAGIEVDFLAPTLLNDDEYYNFDFEEAQELFTTPGNGQSGNPLVINAYFSSTIDNAFGAFGIGIRDQPYLVLNVTEISNFSAVGRTDTFAHELGHVLDLGHFEEDFPAAPNRETYLMTSGDFRTIPQTLSDVTPDGAGLSLFSAAETATLNGSRFVQAVPEPASMLALGAGLAVLARRRRRA